ncbi:MAG: hypothetical protein ACK46Q_03110 [Hyphomonas sp.]
MSFVRLPTAAVSLLLIGAGIALLYLLAVMTSFGRGSRSFETPVMPGLAAPALPALTIAAAETGTAAEAPLFHPDRKPFAAEAIPAALDAGDDSFGSDAPFLLRGVVLSDGIARASFAHQTSGDIRWINRGGMIDGWQLVQVWPGSVVLSRGDQRTTLRLHSGRQTGPAD